MLPVAILFRVFIFFLLLATMGVFILRWVIPWMLGIHDKESKVYKDYSDWIEKTFKHKWKKS